MSNASVFVPDTIVRRAAATKRRFEAEGRNVSDWARENGFEIGLVHAILAGKRPCKRGQSHRIAVALGIKDSPAAITAPPAFPPPATRDLGDLEPAR